MRINFYYTADHFPVVCQDEYYIDMYGDVYQFVEDDLGQDIMVKVGDHSVDWEILQ